MAGGHRFCANYFRLYLHALARNLLVQLRRRIATAAPEAEPAATAGLPAEAQTGAERRRHFRQRRRQDPLGQGQPCTWRLLLIKGAAEVVVSARRVAVRRSSSWPHLGWYQRVCQRLGGLPNPIPASG